MQFFTWRELLIGLIVALAFYVTELLVFIGTSGKRSDNRPVRGELDAIREEMADLRSHQAVMQKELDRLREESETPAPYSQAIRMVRQGMGAAEIAAACDISKGEAELIASLHKGRS